MYFPVVHGGQYDLLALREAAVEIRSSGKVIPVIIPVAKNAAGLQALLRRYGRSGQPFCFVVNPICCAKTMAPRDVDEVLSSILDAIPGYFPTLMVNAATTAAEVEAFRARFPAHELAFFHLDEMLAAPALQLARAAGRWHLLEVRRRGYAGGFPPDTRVMIEDPFNKVNNADYPPDDGFSDTFAQFSGDGFAGFGDYQVIGRQYSPGGFTPRAVALHLTYLAPNGAIRVRHFVSGPVAAAPEVPGRFLEALDALVQWTDERGDELGWSDAVVRFREMREAASFPGLAIPKKLAIRHHLDLVMSLL